VDAVLAQIANPQKVVVLQTAPACRVAIAEPFGIAPGAISTGKLVAAAKKSGFKYCFDTNFTADLTIMEEGHELIERVHKGGPFPMFTSCCPGWVNLMEKKYPQLAKNLSSCRSPMMMLGPIIKTYWAQKMKINPDDIYQVALMPCTAKKDEIERPQMWRDGKKDVDAVLTTRELAALFKQQGIQWDQLKDTEYDDPLGESTGAAALFGVTGGVMEAALRTAYEVVVKKPLPKIVFEACRGLAGVKEATIDLEGLPLKIAIVNGLANTQTLIDSILKGDAPAYHFIEVMCCPSGCIGGGGQPISEDEDVIVKRMEAIYTIDERSTIRKSHENPSITRIYQEFFEHPLSHRSHELLHTHYTDRRRPKKAAGAGAGAGEAGGLLVLFGSQGGSTAQKARDLATDAKKAGLTVRVMALDQFDPSALAVEQNLMVVTSTYGEGELPDNAKKFTSGLLGMKGADALANLKFGVCGIGSTAYSKFCAAAKIIDKQLRDLGAQPVADLALCDVKAAGGGEEAMDEWVKKCFEAMGGAAESLNEPPAPKYTVALSLAGRVKRTARPCPPGYHFSKLTVSQTVSHPSYTRPIKYFELDLKGSGVKYESGDHVYILPRNLPERVAKFLKWYGIAADTVISIQPTDGQLMEMPPVLTVSELFEQYVDLFAPCTRKFVQNLARFAGDDKERAEMLALLAPEKKDEMAVFCRENTFEECMHKWQSAVPPIENLISMVPLIRPRAYSIASSGKAFPETIQLSIVLDQWRTKGGKAGQGLCTAFLWSLNPAQKPLVAIKVHTGLLIPPADTLAPVIMCGLGTGIAPFRGFLQEREYLRSQGAQLGPAILYFGCRYRNKADFVFEEEWNRYLKNGVLTQLVNAFSHDQAHFIFVQDKVKESPKLAYEFLRHPNSWIFYCGPAMGIPQEVVGGFKAALIREGGFTEEAAEEFMQKMESEKRINIESF
jgi:iron-only hydrogenase group A